MKRLASISTYVTGLTVLLAAASPAYAQDICASAGSNFSALCKLRLDSGAGGIAGTVVGVLILLGALFALFFLIMGGIRYASSGGDQRQTEAAKQMIMHAIIGLVIALSAFFILNVVLYFITGQGILGLKIPRLID